ncbi:hypothetical protein LCGC14_2454690, partial [marine sediment metagenome]
HSGSGIQKNVWHWLKIVHDGAGNFTHFYVLNSATRPSSSDWIQRDDLDRTIAIDNTTEIFTHLSGMNSFCKGDDFYSFTGSGISGLDPSIPINSYIYVLLLMVVETQL